MRTWNVPSPLTCTEHRQTTNKDTVTSLHHSISTCTLQSRFVTNYAIFYAREIGGAVPEMYNIGESLLVVKSQASHLIISLIQATRLNTQTVGRKVSSDHHEAPKLQGWETQDWKCWIKFTF